MEKKKPCEKVLYVCNRKKCGKKCGDHCNHTASIEYAKNFMLKYEDGDKRIWAEIEAQPTAPEKEGEWIFKTTNGEPFFVCSKCGRVVWDDEEVITFDYCPSCGALMSECLKMKKAGEAVSRGLKAGIKEGDEE